MCVVVFLTVVIGALNGIQDKLFRALPSHLTNCREVGMNYVFHSLIIPACINLTCISSSNRFFY